MRKGGKYNPMEILHSQLLEVFHEKRATLEARELLILSGKDLNEMIVEAKKRTSLKSASQLIDNDLKKVLIQGERIQRITDLEAENERLKESREKLIDGIKVLDEIIHGYVKSERALEAEVQRLKREIKLWVDTLDGSSDLVNDVCHVMSLMEKEASE